MSKNYKVTNRSSSLVFYSIPDMRINRQFYAGETKQISHEELQALYYQAGGPVLIRDYFLIADAEGVKEFNGEVEPEYYLDAAGVEKLILTGSLDAFLDCLDFAPEGVIDLIKKLAVDLPMTDIRKAESLKEKTGFDCIKAIANNKADKEEIKTETKERRVKIEEDTPVKTENPARRTTGS